MKNLIICIYISINFIAQLSMAQDADDYNVDLYDNATPKQKQDTKKSPAEISPSIEIKLDKCKNSPRKLVRSKSLGIDLIGEPSIRGGISKLRIQNSIVDSKIRFDRCNQFFEDIPTFKNFVVGWDIDGAGRASEIKVTNRSIPMPLGECFVDVIAKIRFSAVPKDQVVHVEYPFELCKLSQ